MPGIMLTEPAIRQRNTDTGVAGAGYSGRTAAMCADMGRKACVRPASRNAPLLAGLPNLVARAAGQATTRSR